MENSNNSDREFIVFGEFEGAELDSNNVSFEMENTAAGLFANETSFTSPVAIMQNEAWFSMPLRMRVLLRAVFAVAIARPSNFDRTRRGWPSTQKKNHAASVGTILVTFSNCTKNRVFARRAHKFSCGFQQIK